MGRAPQCPRFLPIPSPTCGRGKVQGTGPPQDSQQRPGPRQRLTGWPAMLHWREYSDSVAQLQCGRPGWAHMAMSAWQLRRNGALGTVHVEDTRVSSWVQVWAWAERATQSHEVKAMSHNGVL